MAAKDNFFDKNVFDDEANKAVIEVENIEFDELGGEGEAVTDDEQPSEDYIETGIMFIGFVDETRALICSMISGKDKNEYLFYKDKKTGKISRDNDMVIAAAKVAKKYSLTFGVEFLLIVGLIATSIYMIKKANDDRKAKKGHKAPTDNAAEKPI